MVIGAIDDAVDNAVARRRPGGAARDRDAVPASSEL